MVEQERNTVGGAAVAYGKKVCPAGISRVYRKPHTPRQPVARLDPGMNHARTRKLLVFGLVVAGLLAGLLVIRRPLMMTAPNCLAMQWHGCVDTFNGPILLMLIGLFAIPAVVFTKTNRKGTFTA